LASCALDHFGKVASGSIERSSEPKVGVVNTHDQIRPVATAHVTQPGFMVKPKHLDQAENASETPIDMEVLAAVLEAAGPVRN
jgi:hypothetical protein